MNKKIISLAVLLVLLISMAATYVVINQPSAENEDLGIPDYKISDDDVESEVGSSFLEEDDEVDIGDIL